MGVALPTPTRRHIWAIPMSNGISDMPLLPPSARAMRRPACGPPAELGATPPTTAALALRCWWGAGPTARRH